METRTVKIIRSSSGGTAGGNSVNFKISLPTAWVKQLGEDNLEVVMSFDGKTISISREQNAADFLSSQKKLGNKIKKYSLYDREKLCTIIYADHTDKIVFVENFTDNLVKTAFGRRKFPDWNDFCEFIEERCIPRSRAGLREYLECIGLDEYDPFEIILKTKGRMAEDQQWLDVEDC